MPERLLSDQQQYGTFDDNSDDNKPRASEKMGNNKDPQPWQTVFRQLLVEFIGDLMFVFIGEFRVRNVGFSN